MRVHAHTKFCFLCVLTLLFHQCTHCHESGHHHHHHHHHDHDDGNHDDHHDHIHSDLQISKGAYEDPTDRPAGPGEEAAAHEQRYYIQQLFLRYGQQDRLDFHGFQSLLLSLGLGEVRVVGLEHDDLGHDHVAHLDLLEVQEGLHSHSAGHHHHQQHSSNHHHHHHHHHHHSRAETSGGPPTVQGPCSPSLSGAARPTEDSDGKEPHDHGLDHDHDHEHEHEHEQDSIQTQSSNPTDDNPKPSHPHDHQNSAPPQQLNQTVPHDHDHHDHDHHDHDHTQDQNQNVNQENNDLTQDAGQDAPVTKSQPLPPHDHQHHKHQHNHNHHHHHTHDPTDPTDPARPTPSHPETPTYTQPPTARTKRVRKPQKGGGQGRGRNKPPNVLATTASSEVDTDHHDGHEDPSHNHGQARKEKRAVPEGMTHPNISTLAGHSEDGIHEHEECLNLTQLLLHYGLNPDSLISPAQFTYLCPALLYQIDRRLCIRHYHQVDVQEALQSPALNWVWGFLSITVISLLSLLGVVLVPILNQSCFKFLLTFLVALAVGTLSGDALLHLLPHSQGGHDHSHGEHKHEEEEDRDLLLEFDGVWKGLTALAGIYLLFIIEHCINMIKHYKDKGGRFCRKKKKKGDEGTIGRKLSDHKLNRRSESEWVHLKPLTGASNTETQTTELQASDSPLKTPLANPDPQDTEQGNAAGPGENGHKVKKHGHGHSHCHTDEEMKDAGIASIAWMVIMGDGMHNFSDGLAIGAAFSANLTGGISTSVAVFCHELPHELGDFAVLLKAGMSVKQAIVYNVLSALMAYFGMVIGMAVGQYTDKVTSWIFAITAGMFLYVALVDMLPEMLHGDSEEHKRCHLGHFVLQNMGMLTGFGIMLLIAIFEDRIAFA